jgi:hypothetical protein
VIEALLVADVATVFALHASCIEQELAAVGAKDDGVKLLLDKLVAVLLVNLFFAFSHGALAA